jgi:hypothetical protein
MDQQHQFIVLDQNMMRNSNAISTALDRCCREKLQLLIPDVAGFESSKGSKPFDTWRRSLECLRGYPEFVSVSRKLTKMLAEERRTGRPCETLVDSDVTMEMRALLKDLADDDSSALRKIIEGPVRRFMPASLAAWSDSEEHKQWISTARNELHCTMSHEALKELRKSPREGLAEWLSSTDGIRFVFQGIKSRGTADEASLLLSSLPSVSAAFISTFAAVVMYWLAFGGLDKVSPKKVTNDLLDIEYAILGSLSVDLLSNDKRLSTICRAVSTASRKRHAWLRSGKHGI